MNGIDITNRKLIDNCYILSGRCGKCPDAYKLACGLYKKQFHTDPYEEDEFHPERYTDEIIFHLAFTEKGEK